MYILVFVNFPTEPPTKFEVRLIPGTHGLNFSGRVEVNYNNQGWGTICDNNFDYNDARVVCKMLGFKGSVCPVSNAQLGRGSGMFELRK